MHGGRSRAAVLVRSCHHIGRSGGGGHLDASRIVAIVPLVAIRTRGREHGALAGTNCIGAADAYGRQGVDGNGHARSSCTAVLVRTRHRIGGGGGRRHRNGIRCHIGAPPVGRCPFCGEGGALAQT